MSGRKPTTTTGRTVIPCYCWVKKPGAETRCTLRPGHRGAHYSMRRRKEWSNRGPEPQ